MVGVDNGNVHYSRNDFDSDGSDFGGDNVKGEG